MTSRKSVITLLAIYLAAATALAFGHTALALVLVLAFLAIDKVSRSFRNANDFMSSLTSPIARHAADHHDWKDSK